MITLGHTKADIDAVLCLEQEDFRYLHYLTDKYRETVESIVLSAPVRDGSHVEEIVDQMPDSRVKQALESLRWLEWFFEYGADNRSSGKEAE